MAEEGHLQKAFDTLVKYHRRQQDAEKDGSRFDEPLIYAVFDLPRWQDAIMNRDHCLHFLANYVLQGTITDQGCIIPCGSDSGSLKKKQLKLYRIACCVREHCRGTDPNEILRRFENGKDFQGSHLCNNSDCCNPQHLIFEPQADNLKRKQCSVVDCQHGPPHCLYPAAAHPISITKKLMESIESKHAKLKFLDETISTLQTMRQELAGNAE